MSIAASLSMPGCRIIVVLAVSALALADEECCSNVCTGAPSWGSDGNCDDGGPGSAYAGCDLGTDCADCGTRCSPMPPAASPPPPAQPPLDLNSEACTATCPALTSSCGYYVSSLSWTCSKFALVSCEDACSGCCLADLSPPLPPPPLTCLDDCYYSYSYGMANNGQCEDGGPGSSYYSYCSLGHDCTDCGPREIHPPPPPMPPPSPPPPLEPGQFELCSNTCYHSSWSYDYYQHGYSCNDGGPGAEHNYCALGTDCANCGGRLVYPPPSPPSPPPPLFPGGIALCSNTCEYADFVDSYSCNDGGPGAEHNYCALGTNCAGCGPRFVYPSPPPPPEWCDDTCVGYAHTGQCQDGGSGAISDHCEYGTDCSDCGPRYMFPPYPPSAAGTADSANPPSPPEPGPPPPPPPSPEPPEPSPPPPRPSPEPSPPPPPPPSPQPPGPSPPPSASQTNEQAAGNEQTAATPELAQQSQTGSETASASTDLVMQFLLLLAVLLLMVVVILLVLIARRLPAALATASSTRSSKRAQIKSEGVATNPESDTIELNPMGAQQAGSEVDPDAPPGQAPGV